MLHGSLGGWDLQKNQTSGDDVIVPYSRLSFVFCECKREQGVVTFGGVKRSRRFLRRGKLSSKERQSKRQDEALRSAEGGRGRETKVVTL